MAEQVSPLLLKPLQARLASSEPHEAEVSEGLEDAVVPHQSGGSW
jgi:hypothetical protein